MEKCYIGEFFYGEMWYGEMLQSRLYDPWDPVFDQCCSKKKAKKAYLTTFPEFFPLNY